jgi:hypothetical protein
MCGVAAFDGYTNEYNRWFDENGPICLAKVNALQRLVPQTGLGVEIDLGTGRFYM